MSDHAQSPPQSAAPAQGKEQEQEEDPIVLIPEGVDLSPLRAALQGFKDEYLKTLKEGGCEAVLKLLVSKPKGSPPAPSPELYALNRYSSLGRKASSRDRCHGENLQKSRGMLQFAFEPATGPLQTKPLRAAALKKKYGIPGYWINYPGVSTENNAPTVIYCHGGGMYQGTALYTHGFLDRLARASSCRVLAIDYRLCPENTPMDATEDGVNAYKFLIEDLKVPSESIYFAGESGGGQVVLLTLQALAAQGLPQPAGAWLMSPVTTCDDDANDEFRKEAFENETDMVFGVAEYVHEFGKLVRGAGTDHELPPKDPRGSPLYGAFEGLCPLYFSIGETEIFCNEGVAAARRAKEAGVAVQVSIHARGPHGFCVTDIPEAHEERGAAWRWLREQAK